MTTAQLGYEAGKAAYNVKPIGNAVDQHFFNKGVRLLSGDKSFDIQHNEKVNQASDKNAASYFTKLNSGDQQGAQLQLKRETLARAQEVEQNLVNKTDLTKGQKARYSDKNDQVFKDGYDRLIKKQNETVDRLAKELNDLMTQGIKVQNQQASNDQELPPQTLNVNVEVSVKSDGKNGVTVDTTPITDEIAKNIRILGTRITTLEGTNNIPPQPSNVE